MIVNPWRSALGRIFSGCPNEPRHNLPFAFYRSSDMFPANPKNQPGAIMTLTKDNLIQTLYDQSGFSKHQSKALVEEVFDEEEIRRPVGI